MPKVIVNKGLFSSIDGLKQNGFVGFKQKHELFDDCSCVPKIRGVYMVLFVETCDPCFLEVGCGGFFKGRDPNVPIRELQLKWVPETPVIYIGKAGGNNTKATLNSRLKQYAAFGQGKPAGHYGGRYIWQLKNAKALVVCWKTILDETPSNVETRLIKEFVN